MPRARGRSASIHARCRTCRSRRGSSETSTSAASSSAVRTRRATGRSSTSSTRSRGFVPDLSRELTPAQHARIRRQIALIPVYIWLVYSWTHVLVRIPSDEPVRDFVHFYVQGVIARTGDQASLYDIDRMADIAQRVL